MSVGADAIIPPAGASTQSLTGGQDVILIIVLCNFNVPFGKLFSEIISSLLCPNALNISSRGITATSKYVEVAL